MKNYLFSVLILGLLLFFTSPKSYSQESRPNIIIYLADDLGYYDVSVHGAEVVETPDIQKLSEEGITFTNAFIASPACAPSRAALLTGLMPARNGAEVNHSFPKESVPSLISSLRENDYKVYAFGKVAHGKGNQYFDFDYHNDEQLNLFQNVKAFFDSTKVEEPICLFVGDIRPHVRWTPDMDYDPDKVDLPDYFINTKETKEHRARYYTDITGMDSEMGQILEYLSPVLGENTLTLFSSDHGAQWPFAKWNLYEASIRTPLIVKWPGKIKPSSRTEAMVSWVDILPTILDLTGAAAPKGLDGKSFAKVLFGKEEKFREFIYTTHTGDGLVNVYPMRSIRGKKYKLIHNLLPEATHTNHSDIFRKDGAGAYWDSWEETAEKDSVAASIIEKYYYRPEYEFFNIQNDSTEQHNLIDDPQYQSEIQKYKVLLQEWIVEQGDELKVYNEPYLRSEGIPNEKTIEERRRN